MSWDPAVTYVVGHQRPDTDAIAAALGYAWLLDQGEGGPFLAARAGYPGPQTLFALRRFGLAAPRVLADVAPTFGHVARHQAPVGPTAPLSEALGRLAEDPSGARVVPVLDEAGRPLGAVTPLGLARAYAAAGGRPEAFARACGEVLEPLPTFAAPERISDHRAALLRTDEDDFLVVGDGGEYLGLATRGRVLDPPRARLILVDHNEIGQGVPGAEEAEIVGVLDHHRLDNPPTAAPIPFVVEPVGSTCTLVAERCRAGALELPAGLAGVLLSGILSDTLVFRSPTTTPRDREIAGWLAARAGVEVQTYGEELLLAAPGLGDRPAGDIVDADRKTYEIAGQRLTIAQVEVATLRELPARREDLLGALQERREREGQAAACLMVTDVLAGHSRLLCRGEKRLLVALPFSRVTEGEWDLGSMVSRKKELVPAFHAALAEFG